jgi:hypothetical protein
MEAGMTIDFYLMAVIGRISELEKQLETASLRLEALEEQIKKVDEVFEKQKRRKAK